LKRPAKAAQSLGRAVSATEQPRWQARVLNLLEFCRKPVRKACPQGRSRLEPARKIETSMEREDKPASKGPANLSPKKLAEKQRLAEALRENLRRRKTQMRERKPEDVKSGSQD
jgi:hypothetical protein